MRVLSKSQANLFMDCPYKWKKCYVDKIRSEPSVHQARGIRIHEKIENFYKKMLPDDELKNFIKHELDRMNKLIASGKAEKKYFLPLFQELKMQNDELGIKGIVDAVYINPDDDKLIVMDWKTGKYYKNNFDDYRFELALYSELLRNSDITDEAPGYWGIYFSDADELFFEKIEQKYIDKMYEKLDEVRKGIESEDYKPKKNKWCYFCQFKHECPSMSRWGI